MSRQSRPIKIYAGVNESEKEQLDFLTQHNHLEIAALLRKLIRDEYSRVKISIESRNQQPIAS